MRLQSQIGKRYGRLTVLEYIRPVGKAAARFVCRCDCGKIVTKDSHHVRRGQTKSCGCLAYDLSKTRGTHRISKCNLYRLWIRIRQRVKSHNPKHWNFYGSRGIKISPVWENDPVQFCKDILREIGTRPPGFLIDRIDNNGDYAPGNVRWASPQLSSRNTRRNKILEYNGQHRCLTEWCQIVGKHPAKVNKRLRRGWTVKDALETPFCRRTAA